MRPPTYSNGRLAPPVLTRLSARLKSSPLISTLNASLAANLNRRLTSMGIGDGSTMLVQAVEFNASKGSYTVVFSPEGQRILSLGKATLMGNGQCPMLVDV
ncbi:hypothetical protein [Chloroflexus sp.]|uniref:hypothetical protein n=1 Tax=Chloroflexus sp. TaxID=1904827 RepID=UPI002ACD51D6|nr:hypothetical protein [Chloroflexus sp.]